MSSSRSSVSRPTSERFATEDANAWLQQLQLNVDAKYKGGDASYIMPRILTWEAGHQRNQWKQYQEDVDSRDAFTEVNRSRNGERREGRERVVLGLLDTWTSSYVGTPLPEEVRSIDRQYRSSDDPNQWDGGPWHCLAFAMIQLVGPPNSGMALLLFDCDQHLDKPLVNLKSLRTTRLPVLVGVLKLKYSILHIWSGNAGKRFMEKNKCVDAASRWIEKMAGIKARPIDPSNWKEDERLKGFVKLESCSGSRLTL